MSKSNKANKSQMLMTVQFVTNSGHWEGIRMSASEADALMVDWHKGTLPEFLEGIWPKDSCQKSFKSNTIIGIMVRPYVE